MLESVIGHVDIAHAVLNPLKNGETAASPGMKYKHYAPECDVVIADGGNDCKKTASIACREYTRAELSGKNASYSQRNKPNPAIRESGMSLSATGLNRRRCAPPFSVNSETNRAAWI